MSSAGRFRATSGRPARQPAEVMWVSAPPPDTRGGRDADMDHGAIAELLRSRPGKWAALLNVNSTRVILTGRAYRPARSFEAVQRQGCVYARYVGNTEETK
jgi:hypothetical protein